jgi:chloramphenicol 3-O phosphotransferase
MTYVEIPNSDSSRILLRQVIRINSVRLIKQMYSIILNGTSSSGKSSIARAIQLQASVPYIHLQVDMVLGAIPWSNTAVSDNLDECFQTGINNFHRALPILITPPFFGIVDTVILREEKYMECLACMGDLRYITVGVHCPVEVVTRRELDRGDRKIGLAASQFERVHSNRMYNIKVDTSTMTPEQAAEMILNHIKRIAEPQR